MNKQKDTALALDDPAFPFQQSMRLLKRKKTKLCEKIFWQEENLALSFLLPSEESGLSRVMSYGRSVAKYLVKDGQEKALLKGKALLKSMKQSTPLFFPGSTLDQLSFDHIQEQLEFLVAKPDQIKKIFFMKTPVSNQHVENLVRDCLKLPTGEAIQNQHLHQTVLSALLTPLRQNVGSCFATAPGILIQKDIPEQFLQDVMELMNTGVLHRTIEGKTLSVPISMSYGLGLLPKRMNQQSLQLLFRAIGGENIPKDPCSSMQDLILHSLLEKYGVSKDQLMQHREVQKKLPNPFSPGASGKALKKLEQLDEEERLLRKKVVLMTEHPLLKTWEFTIASFSDYKVDFFKWNLIASMGFDHQESGGIGELMYNELNQTLQVSNEEIEKNQQEVEMAYSRIKMTETLMRNASSQDQMRRLKAEMTAHVNHFEAVRDKRDDAAERSQNIAKLLQYLVDKYTELLTEYFQELFDPEMMEHHPDLFEDSPAGFRLVYKYGRKDPSVWSFLRNAADFVDALASFFRMSLSEVQSGCEWEKGREEIDRLTQRIVHHLYTEEFIDSAMKRIQIMHEKQGISKPFQTSPWSYISGGTMHQLVSCYFSMLNPILEQKRFALSYEELMVFLIDTLKQFNPPEKSKDKYMRLLAYSPNHAYTILPEMSFFRKAWENRYFSYTWLRDEMMAPSREYYQKMVLTQEMQQVLLKTFFPNSDYALSPLMNRVHLKDFRSMLLSTGQQAVDVDHFLRKSLPLIPIEEIFDIFQRFFEKTKQTEKALHFYQQALPQESYLPFSRLFELLLILVMENQICCENPHQYVWNRLRSLGKTPPEGLVFADTNWNDFYFTFLVGPSGEEVELWRTDFLGFEGYPMKIWDHLIEKKQQTPWGVFVHPDQYHAMFSKVPENLLLLV